MTPEAQTAPSPDGPQASTDAAPARFDEATRFLADDTGTLAPVIQRRILRLFQRRALPVDHSAADMLTWKGTGGFSLDAPSASTAPTTPPAGSG
jgi:hypothetical protein